ncbi:hypothetical protein CYMTET_51085 [Cymbomonas tetramitiformis]|uniref:SAP domain-containing protein n=1 Tax=Cymbomonas tetramitiformis TaxID=36881 RepID=A0AAE0BMZ8_9CHLO|nr:hypothetical protein CYMTET_51085 [Cymbomonas tetramitiformis]
MPLNPYAALDSISTSKTVHKCLPKSLETEPKNKRVDLFFFNLRRVYSLHMDILGSQDLQNVSTESIDTENKENALADNPHGECFWSPADDPEDFVEELLECDMGPLPMIPDSEVMVLADVDEDSTYTCIDSANAGGDFLHHEDTVGVQTQTVVPSTGEHVGIPSNPSDEISTDQCALNVDDQRDAPPALIFSASRVPFPLAESTAVALPTSAHSAEAQLVENSVTIISTPSLSQGAQQQEADCDHRVHATEPQPTQESQPPTVELAAEVPAVTLIQNVQDLSALTQKALKEQCKLRKLAVGGTKASLTERLKAHIEANPDFVPPVSNISFDNSGARIDPTTQGSASPIPSVQPSLAQPPAAWVELTNEQAKNTRFKRPEFSGLHEEGYPSATMAHLKSTSHPIEFFNMFLTEDFRHSTILTHSNANAWKNRAGSAMYPLFTQFTEDEIDKFIGLHIRHGLSPVPDIRLLWANPLESFVYGDERVQRLFPRGVQRFKELRAFLHISDPYRKASQDKPFIKIQDIIDHVISNSKHNWDVAKKKAELEAAVGTVKVARSADFKVIAFSVYDAKPVHFMTSYHTAVKPVDKTRQVFDSYTQKKVDFHYTRLNVIDDYNYNMNGVDREAPYELGGAWCWDTVWLVSVQEEKWCYPAILQEKEALWQPEISG